MTSPIRLFIFGSCVSRDFIELSGAKNIKLVNYYARSSFASLAYHPIKDDELLQRIESNWQREMISADLSKNIFGVLQKNDFDILLIDLIDERFHLAQVDESYCTLSREYKTYQEQSKYKAIAFDTEKKFQLWKLGIDKFLQTLRDIRALDKVRINEVYWAGTTENGKAFGATEMTLVKRNNALLRRMYEYLSQFINLNQFIKYPKALLVASNEHKWGVQPFHYTREMYAYTHRSLELTTPVVSKTAAGKVFLDLLSAYKNVRKGEFFIQHKGVMYPFKWDMTAGPDAPLVFFTPGRTVRGRPMPIFQRSTYFEHLRGYNCVACFDPTLFMHAELSLGWFQGTKRRFYALELAEIWSEFVKAAKLETKKILYFGTSGGGIPGFHLAKRTPGSTLFMSNVQSDIRAYYPRHVEELVDATFDGDAKYLKNAGHTQNRFTINGHSGAFNLVYAQNKTDEFHYKNHYLRWRELTELRYFESVTFIEYHCPDTGHSPLPAQEERKIIRGILENTPYQHVFPQATVETLSPLVQPLAKKPQPPAIKLRHSAFGTVNLTLPIDWVQDPFKSKNWRHHLNSLRWLKTVEESQQARIIDDFYDYHLKQKRKNEYFDKRQGDHTIALRINSLLELRDQFKEAAKTTKQLNELIKHDIESLLTDTVYQVNNHGLMADLAIINALNASGLGLKEALRDQVTARLLATLSKMYDSDGICLEHSVSYQEYNLAILADVKEALPKAGHAHQFIEKIITASREFLGFHLNNNKHYIPIGDSFRLPNRNILSRVYGEQDPAAALAPFSSATGFFFSPAGYFVFRDVDNDTHLSLVSGWHSHVHKQNDELSLFLYHKRHILFDDPGYSDFKTWDETLALKSHQWHSNFWLENTAWSDSQSTPKGSDMALVSELPLTVRAMSSRQQGVLLTRDVSIETQQITITDTISSEKAASEPARHQFLLTDVMALINESQVKLLSKQDASALAELSVDGAGKWSIKDAKRVDNDRNNISPAKLLVFESEERQLTLTVSLC